MQAFDGKVAIIPQDDGVTLAIHQAGVTSSADLSENQTLALVNYLLEAIGFQADFPVTLLRELSELATVKLRDCSLDGTQFGCPINVNTAGRNELAKFLVRTHKLRQSVKQFDSVIGSNYDVVSGKLGALLDEEELEKFTLRGEDGSTLANLQLVTDAYASINKENEPEAFEWLRKNGLGDIIKPAVHYATLSSAIKDRLAAGGEAPPEHLIGMFTKLATKITKVF